MAQKSTARAPARYDRRTAPDRHGRSHRLNGHRRDYRLSGDLRDIGLADPAARCFYMLPDELRFASRASSWTFFIEGITRFERTRRGCNQRLHLNTATLVTPTVRFPVPNYPMTNNER